MSEVAGPGRREGPGIKTILFVTRDLADNSTGRAYALWLLAREMGCEARVVAPSGGAVWGPLRGTDFEALCQVLDPDLPSQRASLAELALKSDLIVAVKPFPESLGLAVQLRAESGTPLLLDIDDPDIEVRLPLRNPVKLVAKMILRPREAMRAWRMRRLAVRVPVIVSNPTLQKTYGGEVIGHVREDTGPGGPHVAETPSIVFVGTNRRHKGVGVLRDAVARLAAKGFTLVVTDAPPSDAHPWETWVGATSMQDGLVLVRESDIVVIPSMPGHTTSSAQLPAKLIDAMIAGRAIVVSDFPPLRWAIGDAGIVVRPGSPSALAAALARLADPAVRAELGQRARARALDIFTTASALEAFERACSTALGEVQVATRARSVERRG